MPFLDTKRQRGALLIFVLGLGLAYALWPFSTGLLGALVLYVVFAPVHRGLKARGLKPGVAVMDLRWVTLLPVARPELFVLTAWEKFDAQGRLNDELLVSQIGELLAALADWTRLLRKARA